MKNLIVTFVSTLGYVVGFAQGYVNFCNLNGAVGLNAPGYFDASLSKLSGPNWWAGLFAGHTSTSLSYIGNATPFLTGGGAGYFNGGTTTLPGIPGGTTAWLQVVVWDSTLGGTTTGATWAQALEWYYAGVGGVWGMSKVFSVVVSDPAAIPPQIPASLVGLTSFSVCLGCCSTNFGEFTFQPQSQTVLAGGTVTFSVSVAACPRAYGYQWHFDGRPLPAATTGSYRITNVQPTNAGTYWAVVSGPYWGSRTSATATLTVLVPPTVTSAPQSQTVEADSTAGFIVEYSGLPVPACQWFFSGNRLNGATNSLLRLANVQPAQSGPYTVAVVNTAGAVTSPPAMLSVIVPVERRPVPTLTLMGQPGTLLNLDYADGLGGGVNWQPLETVGLTNTSQFYFDPSTPLPAQRFYRGWQAGVLDPAPRLDLHMVPGLVLTGAVGSRLRVDAINVFGPTDAWFTLDTVTLTNTTQLYFDTSSIHQPRRLWRIIPQ